MTHNGHEPASHVAAAKSWLQPLSKHSFEPVRCLSRVGGWHEAAGISRCPGWRCRRMAAVRARSRPARPVVGFLSTGSPDESAHLVAAFRRGLAENGYVEGKNVTVEYRWALGQYDRLPALAAELARRPLAVLVATGGDPARLQPRPRRRRFQSSAYSVAIQSNAASSQALIGRAEMSPESATLTSTLEPKRLSSVASAGAAVIFVWHAAEPEQSTGRDPVERPSRRRRAPLPCSFIMRGQH